MTQGMAQGIKKIFAYLLLFFIGFVMISLAQFVLVIIPPKMTAPLIPEDLSLPREDVSFKTKDGLTLTGWLIEPSEAPPRALIFLHSYPFDKTDLLPLAQELYPDFSFLLFDLRSFGGSGGRYTTFGIKERADVQAAASLLESRGYEDIGVFGYSLGGAVAIVAAAEEPLIDAVASYAAFSDIILLGKETFAGLRLLSEPFVSLLSVWARPLFGAWPSDISPENAARHIGIPILIIHAKTDTVVPFLHAERLKDALKKNPRAEFYFPERGAHGELPKEAPSLLRDFFNRTLL